MNKEELEETEKWFDDNKAVLDRLSKKETTYEDWENFINLIEQVIIIKFVKDLKKINDMGNNYNQYEHYYGTIINNVIRFYIRKWEKKLDEI